MTLFYVLMIIGVMVLVSLVVYAWVSMTGHTLLRSSRKTVGHPTFHHRRSWEDDPETEFCLKRRYF